MCRTASLDFDGVARSSNLLMLVPDAEFVRIGVHPGRYRIETFTVMTESPPAA